MIADAVLDLLGHFESTPDDPACRRNPACPTFVGMDMNGKATLLKQLEGSADQLPDARHWFQHGQVESVLVFNVLDSDWKTITLNQLPRDGTNQSSGADTSWLGRGLGRSVLGRTLQTRSTHEAWLTEWFASQVGERFIGLEWVDGVRLHLEVTIKPGKENLHETVLEATMLAGGAILMSPADAVVVKYGDSELAKEITIHYAYLHTWLRYGNGNLELLPSVVEIDGKPAASVDFQKRPRVELADLADALFAQKAILPEGTTLSVGVKETQPYYQAMISGTIPESHSWLDAYGSYATALDRFFDVPGLDGVYLVLRRGDEVEFMLVSRLQWLAFEYVSSQANEVPADLWVRRADYYTRFRAE